MPYQPPPLNTDLLYRTLDVVIAVDAIGRLNMGSWTGSPPRWKSMYDLDDIDRANAKKQRDADICESTACFAGWALMQEGGKVLSLGVQTPEGELIGFEEIEWEAARLLGFNDGERRALFYCTNDLDVIKATVDSIAAGEYR